jgi:hypothetical protein
MSAPDVPNTTPTTPTASPSSAPTQESWRTALPDEFRNHPDITRHNDVASMAKEYVNAQGLIGRKGVILPKEGDANDQARFYKELGRPETAEAYNLGEFVPPEGLAWDGELQKGMLSAFHEAGLSDSQVQKALSAYANLSASTVEAMHEQVEASRRNNEAGLRREFGHAYEARMNLASRALREFAGDGADDLLQSRLADGSALGDNPAFIRMLAKAAETVGEDAFQSDATMSGASNHTPASAQQEIAKLYADHEFMAGYQDNHHPAHKEAVSRIQRLYSLSSPAGNNR